MKTFLVPLIMIFSTCAIWAEDTATEKMAKYKKELQDLEAALKKSNEEAKNSPKKVVSRRRIKEMGDIQKKIKEKKAEIEAIEYDATMEKNKAITEKYEKSIQASNEKRLNEEKELRKKGAKTAQGIVFGTHISNYPDHYTNGERTDTGLAYYYFNLDNAKIPTPKVVKDYDLLFGLIVNSKTGVVVGCSLKAKQFDEKLRSLAMNAARAKCTKVLIDKVTNFVGIQPDGVEVSIFGGVRQVFDGTTLIYYCDPILRDEALVKAAKESGF